MSTWKHILSNCPVTEPVRRSIRGHMMLEFCMVFNTKVEKKLLLSKIAAKLISGSRLAKQPYFRSTRIQCLSRSDAQAS